MTNDRRGKSGFGKSASDAALRGALLIAVAVILGVLLIWRSNRDEGAASGLDTTTGSSAPAANNATSTTRPGATGNSTTTTASKSPISITGTTHQPSQVKVVVANGVRTVDKYAGKVSTLLGTKGYNATPYDAVDGQLVTNIYWREESYQDDAKAVALALGLGNVALVQRIPNDIDARLPDATRNLARAANIVIILGADQVIKV